jgi:hypothetical protein
MIESYAAVAVCLNRLGGVSERFEREAAEANPFFSQVSLFLPWNLAMASEGRCNLPDRWHA